ncbi:MAG TPA: isopropylmalate isomerase [Marinobacter antarcticus]|uniref:Isopropylmalate isomerase n=2 Tax=root TaxID=1 RepID=A0A831VWD2_9GAMM|nr:isopropylmalate isomerase [Marinobacter antarcticus]
MRPSGFWLRRVSALAVLISLFGCAVQPELKAGGENRTAFVERLADTPEACQAYRQAYVRGFRDNVKALAAENVGAQNRAQQQLSNSRQTLADSGLEEADCARPYCIIEPLQNGRLDTWCGYRLDADEGKDLYQWLDWETVQAAMKRS